MKYLNLYNIAFSDNRSDRWKRHFLFFFAVFIYHLVRIGLMYPPDKIRIDIFSIIELALVWGVFLNMIFSYSVVFFLVPKYFNKKRYFHFAIGLLLLVVFVQFLGAFHKYIGVNTVAAKVIGTWSVDFINTYRPGFIRLFGNPPLICCLLLSLKTLKNWHLEQLKTATLARENASAEIQLLKAQVHPHFLFNTLNNIYSFALNKSPQAGLLVQKLSGMLSYMIHECEGTLVPVGKELRLIQDYVGLEKVRYGNRLDMQVEIKGDHENKFIAPLLMIPFVENSFKHGTSQMLKHPWIQLQITVKENSLQFNLSNSKPSQSASVNGKKGIGLSNVQKRLELLHPNQHELKIESAEETFFVRMEVPLQKNETITSSNGIEKMQSQPLQTFAYARQ